MKKITPFKDRETMSQYEFHTTIYQYFMIAFMLALVIILWFMGRDIAELIK